MSFHFLKKSINVWIPNFESQQRGDKDLGWAPTGQKKKRHLSPFSSSLFFCRQFVAFLSPFVAFLSPFCRFFYNEKSKLNFEKKALKIQFTFIVLKGLVRWTFPGTYKSALPIFDAWIRNQWVFFFIHQSLRSKSVWKLSD